MAPNHNLDITAAELEIESFRAEFKQTWPALCKMLGITPNIIARVEPHVVVAVILSRLHTMYSIKLRSLEAALQPPSKEHLQ